MAATGGANNRSGALLVVTVTVAVLVAAGSWTMFHRPVVHLDAADAVAALPSDDQIQDVFGDHMTSVRSGKDAKSLRPSSPPSTQGCGPQVAQASMTGLMGGAELEATGSAPKRSVEVTAYVFDTAEQAATFLAVKGPNLERLAACMQPLMPTLTITTSDAAEGGKVMLMDSPEGRSLLTETRVSNVALTVTLTGDRNVDELRDLTELVRRDVADPPGL